MQNQTIRRKMDFRGTGNLNAKDDGFFEEEREKKMEDRNDVCPM